MRKKRQEKNRFCILKSIRVIIYINNFYIFAPFCAIMGY